MGAHQDYLNVFAYGVNKREEKLMFSRPKGNKIICKEIKVRLGQQISNEKEFRKRAGLGTEFYF